MDKQNSKLEQADEDVKLAVDLIYLLEINNVSPSTALKAIKIVEQDLMSKIDRAQK